MGGWGGGGGGEREREGKNKLNEHGAKSVLCS